MFGLFNKQKDHNSEASRVEARLAFLKNLQAVTNKIHATGNLDEIMLDLSKDICDLFNCDRLTLYAVSKDRKFIFSKLKTGIDSNKDLVLPIDARSVAGYVALTKKTMCIKDVYDEDELASHSPDLEFCSQVDQLTAYRTKQMLVAPVVNTRTRELLGVVQLLNNRADCAFEVFAEDGIEELCETMAIALGQRMKVPEVGRSKYEPLVHDAVISAAELDLAAGWARRKNIDIEDALIDEFHVSTAAIGDALSKTFKLPYERYKPDRMKQPRLLGKLTREDVEKNQWLPVHADDVGITIITTDPLRVDLERDVRAVFSYTALFYRVTTKREFRQTADQLFDAVSA